MENNNKKRENFVRLANNRTEKIMNMMDLIGNLSNEYFYEYTEEDINKMFFAMEECLKHNKEKFNKNKKKNKKRFTL